MNEQTVSIRTALMPLCYKDFHCLAGDCRDNCCGGWEIAFNKKDYLHIKRSAKSQELREILSGEMPTTSFTPVSIWTPGASAAFRQRRDCAAFKWSAGRRRCPMCAGCTPGRSGIPPRAGSCP